MPPARQDRKGGLEPLPARKRDIGTTADERRPYVRLIRAPVNRADHTAPILIVVVLAFSSEGYLPTGKTPIAHYNYKETAGEFAPAVMSVYGDLAPVVWPDLSVWNRDETRRDRMQGKLRDIKAELRRRMHQPIPEHGKWLRQVVAGHFAYYAVPSNSRALSAFRHYVTDLCRRTLRRRSEKGGFTWERMTEVGMRGGGSQSATSLP